MDTIRFHARDIVLGKKPEVVLRHVNTKLLDFTDYKEKFTFVKMVYFMLLDGVPMPNEIDI